MMNKVYMREEVSHMAYSEQIFKKKIFETLTTIMSLFVSQSL